MHAETCFRSALLSPYETQGASGGTQNKKTVTQWHQRLTRRHMRHCQLSQGVNKARLSWVQIFFMEKPLSKPKVWSWQGVGNVSGTAAGFPQQTADTGEVACQKQVTPIPQGRKNRVANPGDPGVHLGEVLLTSTLGPIPNTVMCGKHQRENVHTRIAHFPVLFIARSLLSSDRKGFWPMI